MDKKEYETLRQEIEIKRGEIYTNQLTMSVGELINLYESDEIELEPAFQRLFRWEEHQETNFIESILLGYPIPAIFVMQRDDGIWDVIDGVQRLSTIYHFAGILRNKGGDLIPPLELGKTKIIELLEGKYFSEKQGEKYLDIATRIDFKRASLPVIILKHGSERKSKFELFKRLNTGGTRLSDQEIRNALILMQDENAFNAIEGFAGKKTFIKVINLSDTKSDIRTDLDIITRFLVMRKYRNLDLVPNNTDINVFLDEAIEEVLSYEDFNITNELDVLDILIDFLHNNVAEDYGFRVYNETKNNFYGAFNWLVFETLIWGCTVVNDISLLTKDPSFFVEKIKTLESIGSYLSRIGKQNIRVIERLKAAKEEAERIFKYE